MSYGTGIMYDITDEDDFYIKISDGVVDLLLRKFTIEFAEIDGDTVTVYWDRRPRELGSAQLTLDYNCVTLDGASPSSIEEVKTQMEDWILNV